MIRSVEMHMSPTKSSQRTPKVRAARIVVCIASVIGLSLSKWLAQRFAGKMVGSRLRIER